MTDDEIIAVVQAHKEGKKIERTFSGSGQRIWMDVTSSPCWDFSAYDYRVVPEPRKPREWWAEIYSDDSVGQLSTDYRQLTKGGELVRVREVIE